MNNRTDYQSIPRLLGDALSQSASLFQSEFDLAKAEIGEKTQQIGTAAGYLAGGAVFVIPALVMALFALSATLVDWGWSEAVAYLTSALIAALIAAILLAIGLQRLNVEHLAPQQTIHELQKDKDAIKGAIR